MKKNITVIIIISVVLAALIGVMFAVMSIPQTENTITSTDSMDILIYDKTKLKAEEITVKNSGGEYKLIGYDYTKMAEEISAENAAQEESVESEEKSSNVIKPEVSAISINTRYTMQGMEDFELNKDCTDALAYYCSYVTALQLVDKTGKKYAEYGLDKPASTVKITFSDNSSETLYIGNKAPNDMGRYMRRESDVNVYLLNQESVNSFLIEKLQMLDKTLTKPFSEYENEEDLTETQITSVNISGSGYEKPLTIDNKDDISIIGKFKMHSPYHLVAADVSVQDYGKSLYGMTGSEVAAAGATDENKKKYGLDKPYMNIQINASDESHIGLLVSEAGKDGSCYVMAEKGNIIYRMTKKDVKEWYNVTYKKFATRSFVSPKVDNMFRAVFTAKDQKFEFDLEHTTKENEVFDEYTNIKVKSGEDEVSYINFTTFLHNMTGMHRTDIDISKDDGFEEIFNAEFSYRDKDKKELTETLTIKQSEDGSCIVLVNGIVEGYTDRDYAARLIDQTDKITGKEDLPGLNDSEGSSVDSSGEEDSSSDSSEQKVSESSASAEIESAAESE